MLLFGEAVRKKAETQNARRKAAERYHPCSEKAVCEALTLNTNPKTIAISKARQWIFSTAMPFRATSSPWTVCNLNYQSLRQDLLERGIQTGPAPGSSSSALIGVSRNTASAVARITTSTGSSGQERRRKNIEYLRESFLLPDVSGLVNLPQNKRASWSEMEN